jgi:hypothetical protein
MKSLLVTAAAAALLAPGIAAAADLTGAWKVDLEIAGMMFHAVCNMKEDGMMALTGTCTGTDANPMPVAMTGMVDGSNVKWAYDITYEGNPMHVAYTGAIKSDTAMDGAVDVQIAQGTFTATKQ